MGLGRSRDGRDDVILQLLLQEERWGEGMMISKVGPRMRMLIGMSSITSEQEDEG